MEDRLQKALISITLKVCEAKKNPFCDRYIITSMTELLRHFKDNGMLKEALVSEMKDMHISDRVHTLFNNYMKEEVKFPKLTDEDIDKMEDRLITAVFE